MNSFEIGRELTAITTGIDAFELTQPDSLLNDGLVPIYLGKGKVEQKTYTNREAMKADLDRLDLEVAKLAAGPRQVFLQGMLKSLHVAVKMASGASPSFEEKVADLVGAPTGREDPAVIEDARGKL
ncbi:MAG: hypothetical protein EON57_19010, partial [Alphaproteobacteria bacterium]